eukprot:TRINITY_DN415_c0_g1_i1.p1 TRINITY_DN415_c0_g1~~TRINITY_DN415_c0_g1_i1.p1  ORF type:complete len:113 (-),score=12.70 TRINITY_DN415_c0_g1_i1:173-511(-)
MTSTTSIPTPAVRITSAPAFTPGPQDLSVTPGGTIYATTPGGTRIVYDRNALLFLRNSPLSKTPPTNMAAIPGVTSQVEAKPTQQPAPASAKAPKKGPRTDEDEDDGLFKME